MGKAASKKSAYLVTDSGFAARFVAALAFEAVVCVLVTHVPSLQWAVSDAVSAVEENLMKGAHALKWWSLIALLASSCCALQILLSAAALGCSGLNSVLGPLRPLSLAVTAALQAAAWHTVVRARLYFILLATHVIAATVDRHSVLTRQGSAAESDPVIVTRRYSLSEPITPHL
jgi:hypothetical protein